MMSLKSRPHHITPTSRPNLLASIRSSSKTMYVSATMFEKCIEKANRPCLAFSNASRPEPPLAEGDVVVASAAFATEIRLQYWVKYTQISALRYYALMFEIISHHGWRRCRRRCRGRCSRRCCGCGGRRRSRCCCGCGGRSCCGCGRCSRRSRSWRR